FGRIDTLIANAGTCEYVDVKQFDTALFRRVMDTNFMGLVYTVAAALPWLRQSERGYLAGMSSSVTWLAMPRAQAYGASKAATRHFLEAMRADLWHEGMDVSVISPGFVQTPLTDRNDFPMPGRITAEDAALVVIKGLEIRVFGIHFSKRFTRILQLLGALPAALRFRITRARARHNNRTSSSGGKHWTKKKSSLSASAFPALPAPGYCVIVMMFICMKPGIIWVAIPKLPTLKPAVKSTRLIPVLLCTTTGPIRISLN